MADQRLDAYRRRREARRTPEPAARRGRSGKRPRFVIQEHQASSHHFDFRLEVEGVLKSWAVPKGPSTDPREKRLAMAVEDHPLDYAAFEGVIPEGEYGAGAVIVWDRGTYDNLTDDEGANKPVAQALAVGHLLVELHGKKLAGGYALQRLGSAAEGPRTSFARLQQRMQIDDPERALATGVAVYYYLFDLLHLEAHDVRRLPLRRRKVLLRDAIAFEDPLRFTPHRNAAGEARFREACAKGWEGLAKRASAPYQGGRTSDWLKLKCAEGQELVIGGFSAPRGSRRGFGALLLGYYEGKDLRYAGKVGTGFDDRTLIDLRCRLDRLTRPGSPFEDEIRDSSVTFVQPKLVAEIGFTEWSADGRLRHPRFLGLRRDKPAEDVGRERTEA